MATPFDNLIAAALLAFIIFGGLAIGVVIEFVLTCHRAREYMRGSRFCEMCGTPSREPNSKFCRHCGTPLSKRAA